MNTSEETFQKRNELESKATEVSSHAHMSDTQLERLKDICASIDPFKKIDEKTFADLNEMGIHDVEDPFKLTNHLLRILEENLNSRQKNEQASRASSREH